MRLGATYRLTSVDLFAGSTAGQPLDNRNKVPNGAMVSALLANGAEQGRRGARENRGLAMATAPPLAVWICPVIGTGENREVNRDYDQQTCGSEPRTG